MFVFLGLLGPVGEADWGQGGNGTPPCLFAMSHAFMVPGYSCKCYYRTAPLAVTVELKSRGALPEKDACCRQRRKEQKRWLKDNEYAMNRRVVHMGAWLLLGLLLQSCGPKDADKAVAAAEDAAAGVSLPGRFASAQRIVSFAPSLTEMLFAMGLGERVVGVSEYCVYPAETAALPKVGGFLNPNAEMVLRLRADCVVLFGNQDKLVRQLAQLGVPALVLRGDTLEDVMASLASMGQAFACEERSEAMISDVNARMARIRERCAGRPTQRVLTVIWRERGIGTLRGLQAAAQDGYYSELLRLAGAVALPENGSTRYPNLSMEGILELDPELVFELVNEQTVSSQAELTQVQADWQILPELTAVKQQRLYIIADDYATIPGPRFILLAEQFARYLHPDIDWDK
jgi:iron complex transport system substrate-binding protein